MLTLNKHEGVATLSLNRPETHNAFDADLIRQITTELESLDRDDSVRAVIITGAGSTFSAGADLNWMRSMANASEAENLADSLQLAKLMHEPFRRRKGFGFIEHEIAHERVELTQIFSGLRFVQQTQCALTLNS